VNTGSPIRICEAALERYCTRALQDVAAIAADRSTAAPQRFGRARDLLAERDQDMRFIFDHLRRSTAIQQLAAFEPMI